MVIKKQPAKVWRIALGAIVLALEFANVARLTPPGSQAEALGRLIGYLVMVILAVWLFSSGLPRSVGHPDLRRIRRRIWYRLVGIGLLAMVLVDVPLASLSFSNAAVVLTCLYWFGWTWVAWLIADKQSVRAVQSQEGQV